MSEELKKGIPKAIVVSEEELTPQEKEQNAKDFEEILKELGVIKNAK